MNQGPRRAIYLLFFISLITLMAPVSEGSEKIFPLDKVKPGMSGYGYTVFSGTEIDKFNIKVIGTVDNSIGKGQLILVKLIGKQVEENGGLSAGMSGSPVYLNGRLAGAISYGFENADSSLALVTPISTMLKMLSGDERSVYIKNYGLKAIPVATPVMISGMRRRGFELASHALASYGFKAVYVPDAGVSNLVMGKGLIKPGSAIALLMATGDYQVSAIGTVTWVDGKDFLAFGHPYTSKGKVDYFAYQANILQTVKSSQMSFKIGTPLKLIGKITQDRQYGILGRLEETPQYIPVQISIKDGDRNLTRNCSFYIVSGEQVSQDIIGAGITDAIDQTIDRVGSGTAKVAIDFETADGKDLIHHDNLFYSKDIAVTCIKELNDLLILIRDNDFSNITLKRITVRAELSSKQITARIVKINAETTKVKAGDTLHLSVLLHKYREGDCEIPMDIKIPVNTKPGKLTFTVSGGSKDPAAGPDEDSKKEALKLEYKDVLSFHDLLVNYLTRPKNNELVLEYESANETKPDESINNNPNSVTDKNKSIKSTTPYYIFGEAQLSIEVQ